MNKSDHDSFIARRWIPWLRNNNDVAAEDVDSGFEKLESDLKGLSAAQQKLVFNLVEQMRICNEEDNKPDNHNSEHNQSDTRNN